MNKSLPVLAVALCLVGPYPAEPARAEAPAARLELVGGPPRSIGGRTVTRTFRLTAEGAADIEWRALILRGVVAKGSMKDVKPGEVAIELELPAVRARIELVQDVQVKQAGKAVASAQFPMELFPEGLAAPTETPAPVVGVIDDAGAVAAFLEKAGWRVVRLTTNLQYREVESSNVRANKEASLFARTPVVLVAANQPEGPAEPMNGLAGFIQNGGVVIFLEQGEGRKNLFDQERAEDRTRQERRWETVLRNAASAAPVVKGDHPALLDLKADDLANWGGSGRIAARAVSWDDWPWQRAWLCSPAPEAKPLLAEYWNGKGRVILCQCDVAERLDSEPAAQILLRNLINCARLQPPPPTARVVRLAMQRGAAGKDGLPPLLRDPKTEELKEALASVSILVPEDLANAAKGDAVEMLAVGCPAVIQSAFDDEMIAALNRLMVKLCPRTGRQTPPEFTGLPLIQTSPNTMDYRHKLLWGLPEDWLAGAQADIRGVRAPTPGPDAQGFGSLTGPPVLTQFERDKVRLVFCALPLDDPENKARNKVINQVLANLADQLKKVGVSNVQ